MKKAKNRKEESVKTISFFTVSNCNFLLQSYKTEQSHSFFRDIFIMFNYMSHYPLQVHQNYLQVQIQSIKCHVFAMSGGQNTLR